MSQPHATRDLSFVTHPTKKFTYIPGPRKSHFVLACLAVSMGLILLALISFRIAGVF